MLEVKIGALCFGLVVGWITYRTLRRATAQAAVSDIASVLGAVGGGLITGLFKNDVMFAWYCIGLAAGFFLYFFIGLIIGGKPSADSWMLK
jgi:hypothetical protein